MGVTGEDVAYNFVPIVLSSLLILQTGNLIVNICLTGRSKNLNIEDEIYIKIYYFSGKNI